MNDEEKSVGNDTPDDPVEIKRPLEKSVNGTKEERDEK